jgi:hypothetical protein
LTSNDFIWWKINGDKKPQEMEFLSRQTFASRENVSVWTERQTDKSENDILLETLGNVKLPCAHSLRQWKQATNAALGERNHG